jgi:hypothetical protein
MAQRQKSAKCRILGFHKLLKTPCDNQCVRLVRSILLIAAALVIATPAMASPITLLIGDKDWFGLPAQENIISPWSGNPLDGVNDLRSIAEAAATDGAQLTDLYSALFFTYPCDPVGDAGCSPNKDTATVAFPLLGTLNSGSITIRMGDFECTKWGAMTVDINGVNVPFCFDDGLRGVQTRTFTLTAEMLAVANLLGSVNLHLDHSGSYGDANGLGAFGSVDYVAFDFFELNGDLTTGRQGDDDGSPVPEPAPIALVAVGLMAIGLSCARAAARGRLRPSAATRRR